MCGEKGVRRGGFLLLAAVSRNLCYTFANNLPLLNVAPAFFVPSSGRRVLKLFGEV